MPEYASKATPETKLQWAYIGAGSQSQNASLYCASEGLGSVVRTSINGETFGKHIRITPDQKVLMAQTIGVIK
jgi:nitroreductase